MTKILVIEDETGIREELVEWLLAEDYEVYEASDGEIGLELAYECQPDLIICDVRMPRMNGLEVLAQLRADPQMFNTPFIFLTAAVERESMRKGMQLGADDYITKPFGYGEVIDAIRVRLNRQAQQQHVYERQLDRMQTVLDEEIEHSLLKSRVMAMFSHDFRNPLTLILSSSNLIVNYYDRIEKDQQIQKLKQITGSVHLLMQMLDEMLLLAEMEYDNYKVQLDRLDISGYIHQTVSEFAEIYSETHRFNYETNAEEFVLLDIKLLRQILHNLLSNAVKYSAQNTEICVRLNMLADRIKIEVEDHGIGIPENYLQRLFQPFQRADNVGTVKGTGLGLTIVKQAVDHCSGQIDVVSKINKGTIFTVTIPLYH